MNIGNSKQNQNDQISQIKIESFYFYSNIQNQIILNSSFHILNQKLRGGGCGSSIPDTTIQNTNQKVIPEDFSEKLREVLKIIQDKSRLISDKFQKEEILIGFQWFNHNKEHIQTICLKENLCQQYYEVAIDLAKQNFSTLKIYVKASGFLFHQLLQITNQLFRIVYYQHIHNKKRRLEIKLKEQFLQDISEIETQMNIESQNIWMNGTKFELQMIKTCLAHLNTDSQEGTKLLTNFLSNAVSSIISMRPSPKLLDSIFEGAKFLLLEIYDKKIKNPIQQYQIFDFFENLKWSIVNQLKTKQQSVQSAINQLKDGYKKYISISQNWIVHFCWVQMLSELIAYRPIISKDDQEIQNWNELLRTQKIEQLSYNKKLYILKYNQEKESGNIFPFLQIFQEFLLIQQDGGMKMLFDYITFDFDQKKEVTNNQVEQNIVMLFSDQGIESINTITELLINCSTQIKTTFLYLQEILQSKEPDQELNKKIFFNDFYVSIKTFNQQNLLLLYITTELNYQLLKEIESIRILEKALNFDKQKINEQKIKQIEDKQRFIYQKNNSLTQQLRTIPLYFIQASKFILQIKDAIKGDGFISDKQFFDVIQFEKMIKQIIEEIKKLEIDIADYKSTIFNAKANKIISINFQQIVTLNSYSVLLIEIFTNPILKQMYCDFSNIYLESQKLSQKNLDLLNDNEEKIKICFLYKKVIQGIKGMLAIHKIKLNQISELLSEQNMDEQKSNQQQLADQHGANLYILRLVEQQEEQIQKIFAKHNQQMIEELNGMRSIIQQSISEVQRQNINENQKTIIIQLLETVSLTIMLQKPSISSDLKDNIQNLYKSLKTMLQEQINIYHQNNNDQNLEKKLSLKSLKIYNCDEQHIQLENIYINLKKLKSALTLCQNSVATLDKTLSEDFIQQLKKSTQLSIQEMFNNMNNEIKDFLDVQIKIEQMVFDKESMNQISKEQKINSLSANLFLFDENIKIQQYQSTEIKIDKVFKIFQSQLNQENKQIQKDGILKVFENQSYKVRECLTQNLIKLQYSASESQIYSYCQNLIKQIWVMEQHPNVRNILKNQEMLEMQKQLFSRDLTTFSQKIKQDFDKHMKEIERLQNDLIDVDNQEEVMEKLNKAQNDFEIYLENITEMSQKLDITIMFLKDMTKDLKSIKNKVDTLLSSVNTIEDDVRRLRGKSWKELLEIRKKKVEQQKIETELDQIHINIFTQEFDPTTGQKIEDENGITTSNLLMDNFDDFKGEVNEFLWSPSKNKKDIMLLKGKAGSGKSRAIRNIEEFLWKNLEQKPYWYPIYISLPSIQNPLHNIIDQGLECENYHFDKIQTREFKEAVNCGQINIVLILDSYDEMRSDYIEQNLYQSNKLGQEFNINDQEIGKKVKIIITTREEILTSQGYQTWFYGEKLEEIMEVELQPFDDDQRNLFIQKYTEISVKRLFIDAFKYWKQLEGKSFSIIEFQSFWQFLEGPISNIIANQIQNDMIFTEQIADQLITQITTNESFKHMKKEQKISLKKYLLQLWGEKKYHKIIKNVNILPLLTTPFMIEMIVQVLPKISQQFSEPSAVRKILLQNYTKLKLEQIYSQEQSEKRSKSNKEQEKIKNKVQEEFEIILENLEESQFFDTFSISNSLDYLNKDTLISNKIFMIPNEAEIVYSALKINKFTPFDFYETFVNYYHSLQLQKLKDLGKINNYESILIDLQHFSTYLALDMTLRQLTQVTYKRKGKLVIQHAQDEGKIQPSWEDQYFSENQDDSEYKQLIKKCSLLSIKGNSYSFNHKSIQEYFVANYVFNIFNDFDLEELKDIAKKEKILSQIQRSFFNKNEFNLSLEHQQGANELLKGKILNIYNIKSFKDKILFILKQSKNTQFIRCASNSIYIFNILEEYLGDMDLSKIKISDTKLNGLSFSGSCLDQSEFNNVQIDSCNFNNSQICQANWANIICREKKQLVDHEEDIIQIKFAKDGNNLVSISQDNKLNLWDISSDDKPKSFNLNNQKKILCIQFSLDLKKIYYITGDNQQKGNQFLIGNLNENNQLEIEKCIQFECFNLLLSLNGEKLAVQSENAITIWKLEDLNEPKYYESKSKSTSRIVSLAIFKQGNALITGNSNGQILLWDSSDLKNVKIIKILRDEIQGDIIQSYVASSNDQIIFAYSYAHSIFIQENDEQCSCIELKDTQFVKQIQFSNVKNQFLGIMTQDSIIIYKKQDYSNIFIKIEEQCKNFTFSMNDQYLAIITYRGIKLIDIEKNSINIDLIESQDCTCLSFSDNSKYIAIGYEKFKVDIYSLNEQNQIKQCYLLKCCSTPIQVQFSKNNKFIYIRQAEGIQMMKISKIDKKFFIPINLNNSITSNFVLLGKDEYIGIGLNDHLCFVDLSNYSILEQIQLQEEFDNKIIAYQFSRKSRKLALLSTSLTYYCYHLYDNEYIIKNSFVNDDKSLEIANLANFSQDEHYLVVFTKIGTQNFLKIINLKEKYNIVKLEERQDSSIFCNLLCFSENSSKLISGYSDQSFKVWATKSCKHVATVNNHPFNIGDISISSKGILAYASTNIIKVINVQALKQQSQEMYGHSSQIQHLSVSQDGIQLISCSSKEMLRWDLKELKLIDSDSINNSRSTFSPNNRYFISKNNAKFIDKFDYLVLRKQNTKYIVQKKVKLYLTNCYSFQFSSDSQYLYSTHEYDTIVKWILEEASLIKQNIDITKSQKFQYLNQNTIFLGHLRYFRMQSQNNKNTIKQYLINEYCNSIEITNQFQPILYKVFAISSDSQMIATQDENNHLIIWKINFKEEEKVLDTDPNTIIYVMAFSNNNTILFTFGENQKIQLWDTSKNKGLITEIILEINIKIEQCNFLAFPFKEEDFLFIKIDQVNNHSINYWFTNEMKLSQLKQQIGNINSVAFCQSKNLLAIQNNKYLELLSLVEEKAFPILEGNSLIENYYKNILQFSSDGNHLYSLGRDHTLRSWDLNNLKQIKCKVYLKLPIYINTFQIDKKGEIIILNSKDDIIHKINHQELQQISNIRRKTKIQNGYYIIINSTGDIKSEIVQNFQELIIKSIYQDKITNNLEGLSTLKSYQSINENYIKKNENGQLIFQDLKEKQIFNEFGDYDEITHVAFSDDFNSFACAKQDKKLQIYNFNLQKCLKFQNFECEITSLCFTPCNQRLILGMENGSILLYKFDQNITEENFVCYKILAKYPLLQAQNCLITGSNLITKENDNLRSLFQQKGAKI